MIVADGLVTSSKAHRYLFRRCLKARTSVYPTARERNLASLEHMFAKICAYLPLQNILLLNAKFRYIYKTSTIISKQNSASTGVHIINIGHRIQ